MLISRWWWPNFSDVAKSVAKSVAKEVGAKKEVVSSNLTATINCLGGGIYAVCSFRPKLKWV